MEFDIFFSICQTDVDGYMPDERTTWIPSSRAKRGISCAGANEEAWFRSA
jgi:hypothetical protein